MMDTIYGFLSWETYFFISATVGFLYWMFNPILLRKLGYTKRRYGIDEWEKEKAKELVHGVSVITILFWPVLPIVLPLVFLFYLVDLAKERICDIMYDDYEE